MDANIESQVKAVKAIYQFLTTCQKLTYREVVRIILRLFEEAGILRFDGSKGGGITYTLTFTEESNKLFTSKKFLRK